MYAPFCLLLIMPALVAAAASSDLKQEMVSDLVEWFLEGGGTMNGVTIRRRDTESSFGVFADGVIEEGQTILVVEPNQYISVVKDILVYDKPICEAPLRVMRERALGDESDYTPYIEYIFSQARGVLPIFWSLEGRKAFDHLLNPRNSTYALPPLPTIPEYLDKEVCGEYLEDREYIQTSEQILGRGWNSVLIPIIDMINHGNNDNVDLTDIYTSEPIRLYAKRRIEPGEEIFLSYHLSHDSMQGLPYGTPELFRDFGFVEKGRQHWHFPPIEVSFKIFGDTLTWLDTVPDESTTRNYFEFNIARLRDLEIGRARPNEKELLHEYKNQLLRALEYGLASLNANDHQNAEYKGYFADDEL